MPRRLKLPICYLQDSRAENFEADGFVRYVLVGAYQPVRLLLYLLSVVGQSGISLSRLKWDRNDFTKAFRTNVLHKIRALGT